MSEQERAYGALPNPGLLAIIPSAASTLLDVGCGAGGTSLAWRSERGGRRVVGIDLDGENARRGQAAFDELIIGDAEEPGVLAEATPLGPFDCIIFGDVLEHLRDPWDVLRRYAGLLAPEGFICACIPNIQHWSILHDLLAAEWSYADRGILDRTHLRFFTRGTVRELFEQAGLVVTELRDLVYDTTGCDEFVRRLEPGLAALGLDAESVRARLAPLQYVVAGRLPAKAERAAEVERSVMAAQQAVQEGRAADALALVAPLLESAGDARLYHLAGVATGVLGDADKAAGLFRQAIDRDPSLQAALYGLALVLLNRGQPGEAAEWLARSVALDPSYQQNRYLLAVARLQSGQPLEALLLLDALIGESQDNARLAEVEAHVVRSMGGGKQAAMRLIEAGHPAPAGRLLLAERALAKEDSDLLWSAAAALMKLQKLRMAMELFERALTLDPKNWSAGYNAHFCRIGLGEVDGALAWLKRLDHPDNPFRAQVLDAMLYVAPLTPEIGMKELRALALHCQGILGAGAVPFAHPPGQPGKSPLRIGFLSRIFHLPNYAQIYLDLFRHLDRKRFSVVALFNGTEGEPTEGVRAAADEIVTLGGLAAPEAAARIREARIDILVDCNGFGEVEGNRILDYKPAPVQAAWSNKHYTTGLPTMDWMLADASIDGVDPACFVERIHRLPCFHIDMPPGPMPPLTPPPLRRNGFVTLGAQIAGLKLNRAMMRSWARMLGRVPDARLFLRFGSIPESHDMIRSVMAAEGIGANRLSLHYGCGHERYLASFAEIDLVLDRFPISGGVTSLEALWQGVPILSWPGESWAAKRGAALLRQLGLGELVAESLEGYVELAVALCRDPDRLVRYRETLQERIAGAGVRDDRALANGFAAAFEQFWDAHVSACRTAAPG